MLKKIYITASACISPQHSFDNEEWFENPIQGENFTCIEPDYKNWIDVKLIRRMNRIVKMGVSASMSCLQKAGKENTDAIVTATGYGCIESTYQFLDRMYSPENLPVNPSAFIQSTHNTIGAQIALILPCKGYNNTIVDNELAFELALNDAILYMNEVPGQNILLGGVDELTSQLADILSQVAHKNETYAGEGSTFFTLVDECQDNAIEIKYTETGLLNDEQIVEKITELQQEFSFQHVLTKNAGFSLPFEITDYTTLCGKYPTNGAFGLWLATEALQKQFSPRTYFPDKITSVLLLSKARNGLVSIIVVAKS